MLRVKTPPMLSAACSRFGGWAVLNLEALQSAQSNVRCGTLLAKLLVCRSTNYWAENYGIKCAFITAACASKWVVVSQNITPKRSNR